MRNAASNIMKGSFSIPLYSFIYAITKSKTDFIDNLSHWRYIADIFKLRKLNTVIQIHILYD